MGKETVRGIFRMLIIWIWIVLSLSCGRTNMDKSVPEGRMPLIEPDYIDFTIPPNIAPMNFIILEEAENYIVKAISEESGYMITIRSDDGTICFPEKTWRKLVSDSRDNKIAIKVYISDDNGTFRQFNTFYMNVAFDSVDPYLAYRLIHPGYYNWSNIKIMQRSIESFSEEPVIDNKVLDMNCINCHSFNQYDPDKFLVHIRGSGGGTYFIDDNNISRRDLKIESMPGGATYPAWHPGGRYVAFSSNQVRQAFYAHPSRLIEVFDLVSSLILYDLEKNDIVLIKDSDATRYFQTFPSWSPDGKYLYFCRALQNPDQSTVTLEDIEAIKYDIVRMPFDAESASFGETEMVFNASGEGKSASFPRISPDSRYLVLTLDDYGTFPIWHPEADLYLVDLTNGESYRMDINSDLNESYHSWSSNGKWIVFSSKRTDGRSTRPFFAYFDSPDRTGKPFILPQKDPGYYRLMLESFNIPEFVMGRINKVGPRLFASAVKTESLKAQAGNPLDSLSRWEMEMVNVKRNPGEKSIHE
jgi:hypothetical protein